MCQTLFTAEGAEARAPDVRVLAREELVPGVQPHQTKQWAQSALIPSI